MLLHLQRHENPCRVCNQRRAIRDRGSNRKKTPTRLKSIAPETSQAEHQKRRDQEVHAGTWRSDHERAIAAHVTSVRLKLKRPAAD